MTKSNVIATALHATLDHVSIDKDAWQNGYNTFWTSLQSEKTLAEAVHNALDAAATDQELWRTGKKKFWDTLKGRPTNIPAPLVGVAKKTAEVTKAAAGKLTTRRKKESE